MSTINVSICHDKDAGGAYLGDIEVFVSDTAADRGGQRKCLTAGSDPTVCFALKDEIPVAVYAYCNLHSLWKAE